MKLIMVDTPKGGVFRKASESFVKSGTVVDQIKTVDEIQPRDDGIHIIIGITNFGVQAVKRCKELKIPFWFVDNAYFPNTKKNSVRIVYNDLYWKCSKQYDWERYNKIGPQLKEWRQGNNIIVAGCGQRIQYLEKFFGLENWNTKTIQKLKSITKRNILLSTKFENRIWQGNKRGYDWHDAWCVVSSYSNIQAEALIEGIPVITTHCTNIGSIEDVDNPPKNRDVLASMAYHQWSHEEIEAGKCIQYMELDVKND